MGILVAYPQKKDLISVTELIETGKVTPVIDGRFPLGEVGAALECLESGEVRGKLVVTVA